MSLDGRVLGLRAGNQRKWNELQNMDKKIQLLSNYLLIEYRHRV